MWTSLIISSCPMSFVFCEIIKKKKKLLIMWCLVLSLFMGPLEGDRVSYSLTVHLRATKRIILSVATVCENVVIL